MCTVTFLPTPTGFVLTHNRDEAPSRSPAHISIEQKSAEKLLFPRDTKAGGAWIVASDAGKTACLLNGAFVKHSHQPPYRRSRGLMLLDFFDFPQADLFFENYDFVGIEPFTFLFFEKEKVVEFRWDGSQNFLKNLSAGEAHFWCSSTLYPPEMQRVRQNIFQKWLSEKNKNPPKNWSRSIFFLHKNGKVGDPENDFVMNRENRVRTVSITQVVFENEKLTMKYCDILNENARTTQCLISSI